MLALEMCTTISATISGSISHTFHRKKEQFHAIHLSVFVAAVLRLVETKPQPVCGPVLCVFSGE